MKKSISIVIPVYNEERFIGSCLEAIALQTEAVDEVIIIDNNSSDDSIRIAKQYPFVRVVVERKQGRVYARNTGFDTVRSDIIGRIDADTILPRNWVACVKQFYETPAHQNQALTGGGYFYNILLPKINGWVQSQFAYRVNRFVAGHYILWGSNMAFPATMWPTIKPQVCLRNDIHEDIDLGIHMHQAGYQITYRGNLRVGVYLKRVIRDRHRLKAHMRRWPETLKVHHYRRWWLGVAGNWVLWYMIQPAGYALDFILHGGRHPNHSSRRDSN